MHTPGPWYVYGMGGIAQLESGAPLAICAENNIIANAYLIAAAPELLAAVKELSSPETEGTIDRDRSARIAALIAKAEGRVEAPRG